MGIGGCGINQFVPRKRDGTNNILIQWCSIWGSHSCGYEEFHLLGYIAMCSPLNVNRRFGGTYHLHLQDQRIGQASRALLATCLIFVSCLAHSSPWRWRRHVPPKRQLNFTGLHSIVFIIQWYFWVTRKQTWRYTSCLCLKWRIIF
jgi:hypothetical protein